ncbi:MAG: type II toxin-antitoxin system HicA family toxin [Anaerolineales bacterium]|nr:type II toxin-antitoxin system HicA family toxin [Anaerolineales bacterium]
MPPFKPIKRKDLIKALKEAGFEGPFVGGKHEFLIKGELRLILPNPHQSEISKDLLARILHQANLTREEWEKL